MKKVVVAIIAIALYVIASPYCAISCLCLSKELSRRNAPPVVSNAAAAASAVFLPGLVINALSANN